MCSHVFIVYQWAVHMYTTKDLFTHSSIRCVWVCRCCIWHVTHMHESCHTHMDESRHTHMDESCHTHMDESCHTHKCIVLVHAFTESHISPFAHVCTRSRARTARADYWLGIFTRIISFGVATMSRLLQMIGFFCKRALSKRRYSAEETYNLKEPTNRSHPIWVTRNSL